MPAKKITKQLDEIARQLADLKSEQSNLEKQESDLQNQLKDTEIKLEKAKTALKDCVARKCNKGQDPNTANAMQGGDGVVNPDQPGQDWSVNNPCPACKQVADEVSKYRQRIHFLEKDSKKVGENLKANRAQQNRYNQGRCF